jgi:hypothetical protein
MGEHYNKKFWEKLIAIRHATHRKRKKTGGAQRQPSDISLLIKLWVIHRQTDRQQSDLTGFKNYGWIHRLTDRRIHRETAM